MQGYASRVINSLLWQGGAQVAGQLISWISTLVVIRLLTPEDYGLVSMSLLLLGFLFMIADLGFGAATVQSSDLDKDTLSSLFGMTVLVNVGCAVLTFLSASHVAQFFSEPRLTLVVQVLSANFILSAIYTQSQSLLVREMDFARKARIDLAANVTAAVVTFTLALLGYGVWALVASILTLSSMKAVLYQLARPVPLVPRFSRAGLGPLVQFGLIITLDRVLFYISSQADIAIAGKMLGTEIVGLYAVALSLAALPAEKVLPIITQVSFAAFSRIQDDPQRVNRNVLRAVRMVSLAGFPIFLGMAAVADDLVPLVLGEKWRAATVPFQLICLVLPLKAIASLFAPALFGVGKPVVNLMNMAIASSVMAVAFMIGARSGVMGLCLAWVLVYPPVFVVTTARALSTLGIRAREFMASIHVPALASIVMLLAVVSVAQLLQTVPALLRLVVMALIGALIYSSTMWLWNRDTLRELQLLRRNT